MDQFNYENLIQINSNWLGFLDNHVVSWIGGLLY